MLRRDYLSAGRHANECGMQKRGPGRVGPSPHLPPVLAAVLRKNAETLSILLVRDLAACIALGEQTLG